MDVLKLTEELTNNPDYIETVLNKLGHERIRDKGSYYQFRSLNGDNDAGCALYKNTLKYCGFSHGENGNIYTLVQNEKNCSFPQALDLIAKWNKIKTVDYIKPSLPFGGFYKKIIKSENEVVVSLPSYNEYILPPVNNFSYKFLKDGIDLATQQKLGIRYSHEDDSILIPIYDYYNRLVGVKARVNSDEDYNNRWYMWKPYAKSQILYGWNWNYQNIVSKRLILVVESEKAVAQLLSMGIGQGIAIGGHNISTIQARYICTLNADKIIVLFDEGLLQEEIEYEAKKLIVDNKVIKNKVGYVYDKDHKYLLEGSKDSPTDNGKSVLKKLVKECTVWL